MADLRIGVIGLGIVGHAQARAWSEWADVRCHDMMPERSTHSLAQTLDCDFTFVTLPTPQAKDGSADITAVAELCSSISGSRANLVLRSTVPIGTTRSLSRKYNLPSILHCPEFLTARCAVADAMTPSRTIIGWPDGDPQRHNQPPAVRTYGDAVKKRFPGVPVFVMTSDASEAVKLIQNSFFGVKLAFFNEMRTMTDKLSICWDDVMAGVLSDGRIAHAHTMVPGRCGTFGFAGGCLPGSYAAELHTGKTVDLVTLKSLYDAGIPLKIKATDPDCRIVEYKEVIEVTERPYIGELISLELDGKEFLCTPDHLMPVLRNGKIVVVRAEEITLTDMIMVADESYAEGQEDLSAMQTSTVGAV